VAEARYQVPVTQYRKIVFAAKVAAVGIFAVGIEFFTRTELLTAFVLWGIAIVVSLWPVKIDIREDEAAPAKADEKAAGKMHPLEEI